MLLVGVKLNNSLDESEEFAIDIGSLVFKDRIPIEKSQHAENLTEIAGELLIAHYTHFLGKDGAINFKNSIESEINVFLNSVIDYYIDNAEDEVNTTLSNDNISDEENKILNKMKDMFKK